MLWCYLLKITVDVMCYLLKITVDVMVLSTEDNCETSSPHYRVWMDGGRPGAGDGGPQIGQHEK